jgi:hypothetical protein
LIERSHVDVHDLYTLVVVNIELLVDDPRRALDGEWLLGALGSRVVECGSVLLRLGIISAALLGFILSLLRSLLLGSWLRISLEWLLHLKQLYRGHELSLSEQSVDLSHELEGHIVFIEDKWVEVLKDDGDLATLEEHLQLVPVVFLLLVVFCVLKRVHLDVLWEVTREDLGDQETVVKRPTKVVNKSMDW